MMLSSWRWMAPLLLRILSFSSTSLASTAALASLADIGSVHLVFDLNVSLVASPTLTPNSQTAPAADILSARHLRACGLNAGNTSIDLANHELSFPIMPLHLLGKKSWNVYNTDNVEKVQRDEARAKAKEEAEEERMQEIDAERRMQILRGEVPTPIPVEEIKDDDRDTGRRPHGEGRERKRRKRHGEDDTDFELRLASERGQSNHLESQLVLRRPGIEAPLLDNQGHIDLFPQERPKNEAQKNAETEKKEKELAKRKKEYEDQYTVKFSDAAGFKQSMEDPWYFKKEGRSREDHMPSKDAWGNEDPRRRDRDTARIISNDPLAMMRQGASQVRKVDKERKSWMEQKQREIDELKRTERREKRKHRHREREDDLEGFSLDQPEKRAKHRDDGKESPRRSSHRHSRRNRSRSPDRDRRETDRHRHGNESKY